MIEVRRAGSALDLDASPMIEGSGWEITPACPECQKPMLDVRGTSPNPKAPHFRCSWPTCHGLYWPGMFEKRFARGDIDTVYVLLADDHREGRAWARVVDALTDEQRAEATRAEALEHEEDVFGFDSP